MSYVRRKLWFFFLLFLTGTCNAQSSFVFVDEVLQNTSASEHISEVFILNDTDGQYVADQLIEGPFWTTSSATNGFQFAPKTGATAANSSTTAPDWQPEVSVVNEYNARVWSDRMYLEDYACLDAGTTSRIRKGWVNTDITPPENFPGTPCLGADWEFDFENTTTGGGYWFEAGLWYSPKGTHWRNAIHLADIYGTNGLLGGLPNAGDVDSDGNTIQTTGWVIIDSEGQSAPGTHYSENVDIWVWSDRFPQVQPGMTLWIMGPRDIEGRPLPHAILTTEHYLWDSAGPAHVSLNKGLGFYRFKPSLLSSWDGGGAGN